jgi:hypothetical protein
MAELMVVGLACPDGKGRQFINHLPYYRDGEDLDELLERQADMIRYLQQHNANLGRRILELQSQALE